MELRSLLASNKTVEVEYPGLDGFKVKVAYLSKDQLRKIGEKSKTVGFDRKTRQPTEELDEELFNKMYIEKALLDWKGLKYEYLKELVALENPEDLPEDGFLDYSLDNAVELVKNSREFDSWITNVISDISVFNKGS